MADKETKTERVQLLMAPAEVAAIDDWGFSNRIRTRAEAIRRLCQMGLGLDANGVDLRQKFRGLVGALSQLDELEPLAAEQDGVSIFVDNDERDRFKNLSRDELLTEIVLHLFDLDAAIRDVTASAAYFRTGNVAPEDAAEQHQFVKQSKEGRAALNEWIRAELAKSRADKA